MPRTVEGVIICLGENESMGAFYITLYNYYMVYHNIRKYQMMSKDRAVHMLGVSDDANRVVLTARIASRSCGLATFKVGVSSQFFPFGY